MKILIITALLQFATVYSIAQSGVKPPLNNTKWKGHIEAPQSMDIILDFRNDTLVVSSEDMTELETMSYSQRGDTVNLRKLIGTSPCNDVVIGSYLIMWQENGDKFVFRTITDECFERASAITSALAYLRVKK